MDSDHSNHNVEIEFDLTALERRLGAWQPSAGTLDRGRMLYQAGRAAAQAEGRGRSWRLASATLALVAVGLGGLLVRERSQRLVLETALTARGKPAEPVPPSPLLVNTPAIEPLAPSSYLMLTARLTGASLEIPASTTEVEAQLPGPAVTLPLPAPLRPRDFQRVLDL